MKSFIIVLALILLIAYFFVLPYLNIFPNGTNQLSTNFTFSPANPPSTSMITFTTHTLGGSPPYSYNWYFGDGSTGSGAVIDHSYLSAGQYDVSLTVTDAAGNIANSYLTVTVSQPGVLT